MPPALIVTGGFDPLQDEGKAYATRLKAAGNTVSELHFAGLIHGFTLFDAISAGAGEAIRDISRETLSLLG